RLQKLIFFLFQSATLGLAAAFVVVWLRPDLLAEFGGKHAGMTGAYLPSAPAPASFREAVRASAPAVVNIHSAGTAGSGPTPWFDDAATTFLPENRIETTLGSGVIVDARGYILTNHHVIRGTSAFQVALADGRVASATVVGVDPDTD